MPYKHKPKGWTETNTMVFEFEATGATIERGMDPDRELIQWVVLCPDGEIRYREHLNDAFALGATP